MEEFELLIGDHRSLRRLRKADITIPSDSGKTVEQLQAEIDQAGPAATQGPARCTVPRSAIHIAENVFQWRGDHRRDQWTRENHIHTLAKALRDGEPLDRLWVMPVGERFYVIDGHHRLAAYDTAGWTKGIPVEVFAGTLTEARVRALASNVKDKLPMTAQAKSEAAWRITKENLGDLKAKETARLTGVSLRQVRYMRKVWRELNERDDLNAEQLAPLTWKKARDLWEGKDMNGDFDQESWKEQKVQEVADLIRRHNVQKGLLEDVEVTAMALQRLSEGLPGALIEEWASDHQELISELAGRIANPPEDLDF
jgi:ParB-like chromosome segregation protein Spo0J